MKPLLTSMTAIALLAVLAPAQPKPRYTVKDLGTLRNGDNSAGYDMNNAGWVVGQSNLAPGSNVLHTFVWYGLGPLVDIGTLNGLACPDCNVGGNGPNLFGMVPVAYETAATDPHNEDFCGYNTHRICRGAIWWNRAPVRVLDNLPGGNNANTFGINNLGQVVGFAENGKPDSTCATPFQALRFQPVIWGPDGHIQKALNPYGADTVAFAFGINDRGQAVGTSGLCSNTALPPVNPFGPRAVLWDTDGTPVDLGNLGGTTAVASSINIRGDVVGAAESGKDGTVHAFLWNKQTGMQDLGAFPGAFATVAPCCNTINNRREVAGFAVEAAGLRALVWQPGAKSPTDLNTLIPAGSPWFLQGAGALNDAGEIVGWGTINGETHAFLAKPLGGDFFNESTSPASTAPRPTSAKTQKLGMGSFRLGAK